MRKVLTYPNPSLKKKSRDCDLSDKKALKKIIIELGKEMYACNGIGMAGIQLGYELRVFVIDVEQIKGKKNLIVFINPKITNLEGEAEENPEGCLSCPGISVPILRKPIATVEFYDANCKKKEITSDGLFSRAIQHEYDHLEGKTLFDSASVSARNQALVAYHIALATARKAGQAGDSCEE